MKELFRGALILVACWLVGCGSSSSRTDSIPTPPPSDPGPTGNLNPPAPAGPNPLLPNDFLSQATSINLADKTNFRDVKAIDADFIPPLVGDALLSIKATKSGTAISQGDAMIGFEDGPEFFAAIPPYVTGTGTIDSSQLDAIFADDIMFRVIAQVSGDDLLNGSIYYSLRHAGETQCYPVIVTCEIYGGYPYFYRSPSPIPQCDTQYDYATPCKARMNLSSPDVHLLGPFRALKKVRSWFGG